MPILNTQLHFSRKTRKIAIALTTLTMLSAGSIAPTHANDAVGEAVHVIQCIGLLMSDTEKHLAECGTNDYKFKGLEAAPTPAAAPVAPIILTIPAPIIYLGN